MDPSVKEVATVVAIWMSVGSAAVRAEAPEYVPQCRPPHLEPDVDRMPANAPGFRFVPGNRLNAEGAEAPLPFDGLAVSGSHGAPIALVDRRVDPGEVLFARAPAAGESLHFEAPDGCAPDGASWRATVLVEPAAALPTDLPAPLVGAPTQGDVPEPPYTGCEVRPPIAGVWAPVHFDAGAALGPWAPFFRFTTVVDGESLANAYPRRDGERFEDRVAASCVEPAERHTLQQGAHEVALRAQLIAGDHVVRSRPASVSLTCGVGLRARVALDRGWSRMRAWSRYFARNYRWLWLVLLSAPMAVGVWLRRRSRDANAWTRGE